MILICVYFFSQGYFTNPQLLQATLSKAGILAPLLFIFLQIIQVIIPIVPGGASSALGITAFGAVNGFIYNYIGICIGSICIFLLVRKYGHRFILKVCKKKDYDKYMKYTYDQNKFDTFFMLAIFLSTSSSVNNTRILSAMIYPPFSMIMYFGKLSPVIHAVYQGLFYNNC